MNNNQGKLTNIQREFVNAAGDLAVSISIARSVGQIYALLYISPNPLSIDDLCDRLGISKGNASMNLRVLEEWEAIERVGVRGSRRVHYEALPDLGRIAVKRIQEGGERRIEMAEEYFRRIEKKIDSGDDILKRRVEDCRDLLDKTRRALDLLPKIKALTPLLSLRTGRRRSGRRKRSSS